MKKTLEATWIIASAQQPEKSGWYEVKTAHGGVTVAPYVKNGMGQLTWLIPYTNTVTEWRERTFGVSL